MNKIKKIFIISYCLFFPVQYIFIYKHISLLNPDVKSDSHIIKIGSQSDIYIKKSTESDKCNRSLYPLNKIFAYNKLIQKTSPLKFQIFYSRNNFTLSFNIPEIIYKIPQNENAEAS